MKEFIEKRLGIELIIEDVDFNDKLPMIYPSLYEFKIARMKKIEWVIAIPKEQIHLSQLRKQHRQMEKLLNIHCCIYLNRTSPYSKNMMIEDKIPFIIEERDIYLPFLGILLSTDAEREIKPVQKISFIAQKLVITAIYKNWKEINVTKAAEKLGISKMSATRCFDEIEYFDIPIIGMKGKSRIINIPEDKKKLWNQVQMILRNPVVATYYLADDLNLRIKGGMSALADYSMISDNNYPTYVISKKEMGAIDIKNKQVSIKSDKIRCIVQEVGYIVDFNQCKDIDPLSLVLSLADDEKDDERIEISVREMLEEYVW